MILRGEKFTQIERRLDVVPCWHEVKGGLLSISELGLSIDFTTCLVNSIRTRAFCGEDLRILWLGGRDSNPDTQIQSLQSYR